MLNFTIAWIQQFLNDEEGAGAIEYGLIVGLIAAIIVAAFAIFGGSLDGVFTAISGELESAADGVGN